MNEAANYDEDAKSDNREDIKKKLNSLQARKWLSEHRTAIDEEVDRLKLLSQIQKAREVDQHPELCHGRKGNWRRH